MKNPGAYTARLTLVLIIGSLFQTFRYIERKKSATSKPVLRSRFVLDDGLCSVDEQTGQSGDNHRCSA